MKTLLLIDNQDITREGMKTVAGRIGGFAAIKEAGSQSELTGLLVDNPNAVAVLLVYDGSLVMGNLMLAAHDLGIGSCWIHRAKEEFESSWGRELLASLGIEDEYEGIGHCALGYVDGDYPDVIPRKENRVFYLK